MPLLLALLIGAWARWPGVFANTFHADEALFATWSRLIALLQDPLLRQQPVDKPPLLFYATALLHPLLQTHATWVARLIGWTSGMLSIPLTALLGRRLIGSDAGAWVPALLVALSPLAIQFSPAAFTDYPYVLLTLAALAVAVNRGPAGRAGLLLGFALAVKYQAALFLPLLLALGALAGWQRRDFARLAACFALPVLLVLAWELFRSGGVTLINAQLANVGGLRPARSWELAPRAGAWIELAGYSFGARWWSLLLLAMAVVAPLALPLRRAGLRLLWLFGVAYLAAHWLLAVPVWDRYLLPLLSPAALLAAAVMITLLDAIRRHAAGRLSLARPLVLPLVAALWLAGSAGALLTARAGGYPLGATPGSDGGAAQLAAYLDRAPWGTVLYDHWQSWQWRYYFLNRPVYVHWFPHPAALAEDLAVHGQSGQDRYLALPERVDAAPLLRAVRDVGYDLAFEATFRPPDRAAGVLLFRVIRIDE